MKIFKKEVKFFDIFHLKFEFSTEFHNLSVISYQIDLLYSTGVSGSFNLLKSKNFTFSIDFQEITLNFNFLIKNFKFLNFDSFNFVLLVLFEFLVII